MTSLRTDFYLLLAAMTVVSAAPAPMPASAAAAAKATPTHKALSQADFAGTPPCLVEL